MAASPQPTGNLRPLSLAPRPLQLRSSSPADSQSQQPSPAPSSCNVTPKPSVDRQQRRYSTLSYASPNSPSPSVNGGFTSPVQSPIPGGLSRSSSKSGARGSKSHRASMDVSLLNGIGPKRPSSFYGSQPVTPAIGGERTPDLSSINDIFVQDSAWIRRDSTDGQSVAGTEASSAAAVRTLAETHAELLHSIAQKEAKCLELRTALSQQESELKELKAQWTSIVQKTVPSSSAGGGSISLASAAVIREGMGRLFSNVTAPLASALDALDPMLVSPIEPPSATADNLEAKGRSAAMVRGHTPGSSSRSSVSNSSFAASRHSISSASSSSRVGRPDSISSLHHFDDAKVATNSPLSRTGSDYFPASAAELAAEADRGSKSVTPTPTGSGDSASANGWAAAIPGIDGLNKKWEEMQRGDTFVKGSKRASVILSDVSASFISTFAPPLNEPLRPQKPRLLSRPPAGAPPTSFTAPNPPVMSPTPLLPATSSNGRSLLDDDDGEAHAQPLMVPSKPTPLSASGVSNVKKESPNSNNEDDEAWNW